MWVRTHDNRLVNLDRVETIAASVGTVLGYLPSVDNTSIVLADFKGDQEQAMAYIKALGDDLAVFEVRPQAAGDDVDFFVEPPAVSTMMQPEAMAPAKVLRIGDHGAVVTDDPVRPGGFAKEDREYYGGNLVCESITTVNAKEMVKRWNAHEALVLACEETLAWATRECQPQGGKNDGPWELLEGAVARVR